MDKLLSQFCEPFLSALAPYEKELLRAREVRIRVGQPLLLCGSRETAVPSLLPDPKQMSSLLLAFCGQALYAHEEQLRQGYLTLPGGHRVGVCGQAVVQEGQPLRFAQIQGLNVRIARQMACERRALEAVCSGGALRSALIVSPPGLGKTTMLRELARVLSSQGAQVAIADERGELAACVQGVPQLDVGPRTDVMDGVPRAEAVRLLVRAMSPELVVCDEIGSERDADALLDARRCGVHVLCSAHGASYSDVKSRPAVRQLLREGMFDRVVLLGREVGRILAVYDREGRPC